MRARSWMAILALIAGSSIAVQRALPAQAPSPKRPTSPAEAPQRAGSAASTNPTPDPSSSNLCTVQLDLVIAGLGREGCQVEVKPGNPGCKFRTFRPGRDGADGKTETQPRFVELRDNDRTVKVPSAGLASLELRDIELLDADHTLTVAIIVHEAGQPSKTIYRGFRLKPRSAATGASTTVPVFKCYLSSPSKVARLDETRTRK